MRKSSKTLRRLGLVAGAATVVGTASIAGMPAAFASSPTGSTLSITPTTPTSTSVATDSFTTTAATGIAGGTNTVTLNSLNASGGNTGTSDTTNANYEFLPAATADYVVSYTASGSTTPTSDVVTGVATATGGTAGQNETLTLTSPIPASAKVTITVSSVTNAQSAATVYFSNETSGDTTAQATNTVSIGTAAVTTATVTSVNPQEVSADTATPFTITGSNFATATAPTVCFIPVGTTPAATCAGTTGGVAVTAALSTDTATELQGVSPTTLSTTANTAYNVVVYNGGTTTASAVSAADQVTSVIDNGTGALDFYAENGVRVVDTRSGMNAPTGAVSQATPTAGGAPVGSVAIPLTAFDQSAAVPTNIPGTATAIAMNVTAIAPSGVGNLQVYEAASCPAPGTAATSTVSTVNFQPGVDTSNYAIVPLNGTLTANAADQLCVTDNGAAVNFTVDVTGYEVGLFTGTPARLLDTRPTSQTGSLQGPLASGTVYQAITGLTPDRTYALDVTAVAPTSVGYLTVFPQQGTTPPAPSAVPNTAAVNYIPGVDSGSYLVVNSGTEGTIDLYSGGTGTVNVVIDQYGRFRSASHVTSLAAPYRLIDTRPGGIASGSSVTVTAAPTGTGSDFVPGNAVAVFGDLSDINPTAVGYENVYPTGSTVPNTANIANYPNQVRENTAVASLIGGKFNIQSTGATTNSTYDVTAYVS